MEEANIQIETTVLQQAAIVFASCAYPGESAAVAG